MKVSILVPVYGVEQYIERCAISLFEQTYPNIEFIFVDDCSPDNSIIVLRKVLELYPKRKEQTKIISHTVNHGVAVARNTAISHATGDFLLWVDPDDYVDRNLVDKVVRKQRENDYDIVCFDAIIIFSTYKGSIKNGDYADTKDYVLKLLSGIADHQMWGHLIRLSLYTENQIIYEANVNQAEDFNTIVRLAYYSKKITTLHEALYNYDMTRQSSYCNQYSVRSELQIRRSYEIVRNFYSDKEACYLKALNQGELKSIPLRLRKLSQIENDEGTYDYLLGYLLSNYNTAITSMKLYDLPVLLFRKKSLVKRYALFLQKLKALYNSIRY